MYQQTLRFFSHFLSFKVPEIFEGKDALSPIPSWLKKKGCKHPLLVCGKGIRRAGLEKPLLEALAKEGIETSIYDGVVPNPTFSNIYVAKEIYLKENCDSLIALGGGSNMDAAKALGALLVNPKKKLEDLKGVLKVQNPLPPLIAIPTTAGTGSEATIASVIVNEKTGDKFAINDPKLIPQLAVFDDSLLEGLPPSVVASTGMDALTHCIESYVATAHSPYSDALALYGCKMIQENLVASYKGDQKARAAMHDAQCIAGMSFANGMLGIVHSMAHKTGAAFKNGHIIHGAANAMYLPKVIKYNAGDRETAGRFGDIADELNLGGLTTADKVENLIGFCEGLNHELNIPMKIQNYGEGGRIAEEGIVPADEFEAKKADIAANALLDACTGCNPRPINQKQMEQMLTCCYYGKEVLF